VTLGSALLVALAALVAGLAVGWWVASHRHEKVNGAPAQREDEVGPILAAVRSSAILLDGKLHVLRASPSAYAYGLVRAGQLAMPELYALAAAAHRDGQSHESVLTLKPERRREPGTLLGVRATGLAPDRVLLLLDDRTRAERAEETRRDFVANISHELKTPVGAISLLAEAVGDAADDPEAVRRFAQRLQRESTRLGKLVTEVIDLSRLQFDNPVENAPAVRVDVVIAEAMDRCRSAAELKSIRLVRGGPPGLQVIGDKDLLVTALGNLVENAIAYSPEHTRVAIATRLRDEMVEVTVTDQGIGIPEGELDRIFERFYRVDPARSRQTGGTGLGLSIVKHIVASHRGEVSVWSAPSAGSTFTLRLPMHPVTEDAGGRSAGPANVSITEGTG
jgi:two-component system, OmpR family, sensor histidine kinase SenX3